MKKFPAVLVSLFFIACSKNNDGDPAPAVQDTLAAGWKKVALPAMQSSSDIFFINNTTGFVAGGSFISRSEDGGNTWQRVYQSSARPFVNIAMGSTANAIFVPLPARDPGGTSKLILTSDGGNSFDSVYIADGFVTDAFFVSPSIAYAIGRKCWKTTNGGLNWTDVYDFGTGIDHLYKSLHFLNEQTGWIAGSGGVYKTTTGGTSWNPQPVPAFDFSPGGNVFFVDENNGYISDNSGIGKSTNGGTSWNNIHNTLQSSYHDLHFLSDTEGYVTNNQYIYKTTNGGTNWTKEISLANESSVELHFTDPDHGWATLNGSFILKYER